MRLTIFCHSLLSDWNHGNAHFLRGVVTELLARGHDVRVFEPRDAWSVENLVRDHGDAPFEALRAAYPSLSSRRYTSSDLDLDEALDGADLVLVHEWNDPALVARIGERRKRAGASFRLLFHDTHHRSVTAPDTMRAYDLSGYDGALAFGAAIRDVYVSNGWAERVFVWHEAADVRVFHPRACTRSDGDVVWIGNWGDDERTNELSEYLFGPISALGLSARVHGVRYPEHALAKLRAHGIAYAGWLPNFHVPATFASFTMTVHVPRRPYAEALPGIPTIRVFEALACGIPLVSAPWEDAEGLFTAGSDFLVANDGASMRAHMRTLLHDRGAREALTAHGLRTIFAKHTCAHRVDELLEHARSLGVRTTEHAGKHRRPSDAQGAFR